MMKLVPFAEENIERLISWIPGPRDLLIWAGPRYVWPIDRKQIIKEYQESLKENSGHAFLSADVQNSIVGHVEFLNIDHARYSAYLGRVIIDPVLRGRGLGVDMIRLAIEYAKMQLLLNHLSLNVFDFNKSAVYTYEKCGFETQEVKVGARDFEGEKWNLLTMKCIIN